MIGEFQYTKTKEPVSWMRLIQDCPIQKGELTAQMEAGDAMHRERLSRQSEYLHCNAEVGVVPSLVRLSRINKRYDRSAFQSIKTHDVSLWIKQNVDIKMELHHGDSEKLRSARFITYNKIALQFNASMKLTQTK